MFHIIGRGVGHPFAVECRRNDSARITGPFARGEQSPHFGVHPRGRIARHAHGVDVRDSTPTTTASPVTKPRIRLPKVRSPARRLSAMKRGIHRRAATG